MLRLRNSSRSLSSFRPTLEMLEDRTVPSLFGNIIGAINPVGVIGNLAVQGAITQVNNDVAAFNKSPTNAFALAQLLVDTGKLQALSVQVNTLNAELITYTEQSVPFLSSADKATARGQEDASNQLAVMVTGAANDALASFYAAFFVFLSQGGTNLVTSVPGGTSSSGSSGTGTGTFSETINKAPATYPSDAQIGPSESVTVTNPTNTPLTVKVSYSDTAGNQTSQSDVCTNSTVTVTGAAPVAPPGTVGTWTVGVTGQPDQTNTTTFQ